MRTPFTSTGNACERRPLPLLTREKNLLDISGAWYDVTCVDGVLDLGRENRGEHVLDLGGGRERQHDACAVPWNDVITYQFTSRRAKSKSPYCVIEWGVSGFNGQANRFIKIWTVTVDPGSCSCVHCTHPIRVTGQGDQHIIALVSVPQTTIFTNVRHSFNTRYNTITHFFVYWNNHKRIQTCHFCLGIWAQCHCILVQICLGLMLFRVISIYR